MWKRRAAVCAAVFWFRPERFRKIRGERVINHVGVEIDSIQQTVVFSRKTGHPEEAMQLRVFLSFY